MYYSLTFTINGVEKNTWDDWEMIPNTPPMIPPPEPNLNYVEIPGRSGGPLDLSAVTFNKITYKRMAGNWTFLREPTNRNTRKELYEELVQYFNGKVGKVTMEEEPDWYYVGRFVISVPATSTGPIKFTIGYDLAPVRYSVTDDTADSTYGGGDVGSYSEQGGNIPSGGGQQLVLQYNSNTQDLHVSGFN